MALATTIRDMSEEQLSIMEKLFNTAYVIAKEDYALNDFRILCQMQMKNGVKMGETYLNDKGARQFIKYIAETMRTDLKSQLSKIEFFSLMADGSTDKSVMASEIIYICYLHEGEPKCNFISLTECQNEKASGIKSGIVTVLNEFIPNWEKKLTAVCFDGANVNMGSSAGVSKLLENECGHLISVHCIAHRLELAMSDAIKYVKHINIVEEIVKGVYSYYHSSPKRTKELKAIGEILDEKILSHVGLHGIRWLQSRHRAVKVMLNNFSAVVIHMEQAVESESDSKISAKLTGYLKHLKSEQFIRFLFLMEDVTNIMARMSEVFQKRCVLLSEIFSTLEATKLKIKKLSTENGNALDQFEKDLVIEEDCVKYREITLKKMISADNDLFQRERKKLCESIIESLNIRYENVFNDKLLGNLNIFDPCNVVNLSESEDEKLNQQLKDVIKGLPYNINIDEEAMMDEFEDFKVWSKNKLNIPCQSAWQRLLAESKSSSTFINLRKILEMIITLPLSTAECERGFSHMNIIKTDTRCRMVLETLNDLMFIKLYGPSLTQFNPRKAVEAWWSDVENGRKRRPDFKK